MNFGCTRMVWSRPIRVSFGLRHYQGIGRLASSLGIVTSLEPAILGDPMGNALPVEAGRLEIHLVLRSKRGAGRLAANLGIGISPEPAGSHLFRVSSYSWSRPDHALMLGYAAMAVSRPTLAMVMGIVTLLEVGRPARSLGIEQSMEPARRQRHGLR